MDDRQHKLFGGRAGQTVLDDRADRRIPGHIRARQVREKVEGMNFVLEPGLGVNLRFVLVHIGKMTVHRMSIGVAAQRGIVFQASHARGSHAFSLHGYRIAAALGAECATGFLGRREWIEALVGPVVEYRSKRSANFLAREIPHEFLFLRLVSGIVGRPSIR